MTIPVISNLKDEQSEEFKNFLFEYKDKIINKDDYNIYDFIIVNENEKVISFTELTNEEHLWMVKYCKLDFVQDMYKEFLKPYYEAFVEVADQITFEDNRVRIIEFEYEKSKVYFFEDVQIVEGEDKATVHVFDQNDSILFYGDTYFLELIYKITSWTPEVSVGNIKYRLLYFGVVLLVELDNYNVKFTINDKEYIMPYFFSTPFNSPRNYLELPNLVHSYNVSDIYCKNYLNRVMISHVDLVYHLFQFFNVNWLTEEDNKSTLTASDVIYNLLNGRMLIPKHILASLQRY